MKTTHARPALKNYLFAGIICIFLINTAKAADPQHLFWAEDIALNVSPDLNRYASQPSYIHWPDANGNGTYENRTKCASFITQTLMQSYGWTSQYFRKWLSSTSPTAEKYFNAIRQQNGFIEIDNINDIQPGDIIAIKYPAGSLVTGHMSIANSPAVIRSPSPPTVAGSNQYEIQIIDSSQTGHGPNDTRLTVNGTYHSGAGIGFLRLYADSTGTIVGYTWSTFNKSIFYSQQARPIAVGRLI